MVAVLWEIYAVLFVFQLVCFNKLPLVVTILADRKANTGIVAASCHCLVVGVSVCMIVSLPFS